MKNLHLNITTVAILFLIGSFLFAGWSYRTVENQTITIQKEVDIRDGPGSYYELIGRAEPGSEGRLTEKKQQWIKIKLADKDGWIPENSVGSSEQKKNRSGLDEKAAGDQDMKEAFDELSDEETKSDTGAYASPAEIAGAVKGFAERFAKEKTGQESLELEAQLRTTVNSEAYRQFRQKRFSGWTWELAQRRFPINADTVQRPTGTMEKMGWGIANVIAEQGLIRNKELRSYLTKIALSVIESSHRYETPVHVYILDSSEITGYACPNGTIFVTKGALKNLRSEAEFAFFIAHEWAHIAMNHGIKEVRQRSEKIEAQDAFAEMERELGNDEESDKYDEIEEDLNEWANQVYEYIHSDRLNKYEFEADRWGLIYTYRSGFDPSAAIDLLRRMKANQPEAVNKPDDKPLNWTGAPLSERLNRISALFDRLNTETDSGKEYMEYFRQRVSRL